MIHMSLRTRLLASYLLLLTMALGTITMALIILLSTRPAPPEPTYERLTGVARGINLSDYIADILNTNRTRRLDVMVRVLDEIATTRNVRILTINTRNQTVIFDSDSTFARGDYLPFDVKQQVISPLSPIGLLGDFYDPDGTEWLFVGAASLRQEDPFGALLLAEQRPNQSLRVALEDFGSALLLPMLQAAFIGLVVAVALAFFISRSIARPLQAVARAATAVAEGHFDEIVPVSGPPEVRAVGDAFNRMSAEVRANQTAQRDFLANVSHDLKTPLTSIQGYSQAILDGTAQDATQAANIIYDEASRLNRMVIELTDLARIEAGRLSMQTTAIDIGQMAAAISQRLAVVARKKGVTLHVDAPSMPEVAGDGDRLVQVLTNLISNGIKYTPTGGDVWVTTRVNKNGVEVIVKDTGVGVPAADLPRVFERFYQVDKARGPKRGTGLGLAITAEIVQAHGGQITVASAGEGQGTTFTVWLPSPQMSTIVRGKR